ncbi:PaaI family thioesterase [bacterium]|nr:MAG: PaaI family thioesterase [bacterium]
MPTRDLKTAQSRLVALFDSAPIIQTFGMKLAYDETGRAVVRLPFNPNFDHAFHQIHGGVMATLLDTSGWFTAAPHFENWIATVEFQTRLLEPVEKVALVAAGKIVRLGKRIAVCEMEVRTAAEKLIALGAGTFTTTSVPAKW